MSSAIGNSNMQYLKLSEAQYSRFRKLMMNIPQWNKSLNEFVQAKCKVVGFSGNVLACAVADWIKQQE